MDAFRRCLQIPLGKIRGVKFVDKTIDFPGIGSFLRLILFFGILRILLRTVQSVYVHIIRCIGKYLFKSQLS